jgi:hypothetical protein
MTNDEIISRGQKAAGYLADREFLQFFADVQDDLSEALFNLAPIAIEERERMYYQHRAIGQVLGRMQHYANQADLILNPQEEVINTFDSDD